MTYTVLYIIKTCYCFETWQREREKTWFNYLFWYWYPPTFAAGLQWYKSFYLEFKRKSCIDIIYFQIYYKLSTEKKREKNNKNKTNQTIDNIW